MINYSNYKGQFKVELDVRFFQRVLFKDITDSMYYTFEDIHRSFLPVGLPSGAQRLVSFVLGANPILSTYEFTYTYINSLGASVTVTGYSGSTLADFYSAVETFFGEKIETLLSVTVVGNVKTEERQRFNALNNGGYFVRSVNGIFLYTMNSPRNKVEKSITFVDNDYVKYNEPVSYKRFTLNLERDDYFTFNYVYITVMERYYFIDDMVMMDNYYKLSLSEDVLMSFADLIKSQTAFVNRSQSDYDLLKQDDLVTFDHDKSIGSTVITPSVTLFPTTQTVEDTRYSVVITTVIG